MTTTNMPQFYTFNPAGLNPNQAAFLFRCEQLFFEGSAIDHHMCREALKRSEATPGADIHEAWEYWKDLGFALDRQSMRKPIMFKKVFAGTTGEGSRLGFTVTDYREGRAKAKTFRAIINKAYFDKLGLDLIYPFTPADFYFTIHGCAITGGASVHLCYHKIIGSRFICKIK